VSAIRFHIQQPIILIILIFVLGCATRDDFRQSFIARHVKDGEYANQLKGFRLKWPDSDIWMFRDYPEFDLSFDHIDGRSQILVIGVNGLIRREFPDGFHDWIMDRLNARNIQQITHEDLTHDDIDKFRIITECEFVIKSGQKLGVHRVTDTMFFRRNKHWVAMMCICPVNNYEQRKPLFDEFFANISML
jgi:hypothetical protein